MSFIKKLLRKGKDEGVKGSGVNEVTEEFKDLSVVLKSRKYLRPEFRVLESYPLTEPWAYAVIIENINTGEIVYNVEEVGLSDQELKVFKDVMNYLTWELEPPKGNVDIREYFQKNAMRVIKLFQIRLGKTPMLSWSKITYYVEREILGYGFLDPLFRDPNIEDISCNGPGKPIYVWHRKYESIPTNLSFPNEEELSKYILKLAHMAGKHISVAYPVLDAILPGGHRVAATFQKEVSTKGSTFAIRKFREDPITVIDMINFGTISPELAAYFWLLMDYKMVTLILGATGAGKTSTLNALACLLRPTYKIVTVEDTPELRLPQENWVQLVSRPSYLATGGPGEIDLFQLVKVALRYRPDVLIVGEVRGEEAYVLFQAIATGHSGMTTLHAESIEAAVKRLTSPPMNIPQSYIPLINVALVIKRVTKIDEFGRPRPTRRITNVWEVEDYEKYLEVCRWDPVRDKFELSLSKSLLLKKISEVSGKSLSELLDDLSLRKSILEWLAVNKIRSYKEVAKYVYKYYLSPKEVLSSIKVMR
ncbi:MAG: type II/IV secretion system ATPase subunit [Desulfurococcaceae archaeon]|nr:type II/IV secretion system ATPase subunit [Desulfurococcaceae archaeon]